MFCEIEVKVKNRAGLHTRPAAQLVKLSSKYVSDIDLIRDGFSINAKSIIGVMTLAAEQGCPIIIQADGSDADIAVEEIAKLFNSGFGELC
jgi:phosphocarrier protein